MIPSSPLEQIFAAAECNWSRENVESSIDGVPFEAQIVDTLFDIPFIAGVQNCCVEKKEENENDALQI